MDQRQQPSRVASKRKSEDIETDDDHLDEMEDLQERLDRILGSDSGSEYSPDKDSPTHDEDDEDPGEEDEVMSDDSEIEQMKEEQRRRLNELITDRTPKPNKYELKTPSPSTKSKSKKSEENVLSFDDLRCVPSLVKECLDPLQRNILFMAEKKVEAAAAGKSFHLLSERTHTEDIRKHLRRLMIEAWVNILPKQGFLQEKC